MGQEAYMSSSIPVGPLRLEARSSLTPRAAFAGSSSKAGSWSDWLSTASSRAAKLEGFEAPVGLVLAESA